MIRRAATSRVEVRGAADGRQRPGGRSVRDPPAPGRPVARRDRCRAASSRGRGRWAGCLDRHRALDRDADPAVDRRDACPPSPARPSRSRRRTAASAARASASDLPRTRLLSASGSSVAICCPVAVAGKLTTCPVTVAAPTSTLIDPATSWWPAVTVDRNFCSAIDEMGLGSTVTTVPVALNPSSKRGDLLVDERRRIDGRGRVAEDAVSRKTVAPGAAMDGSASRSWKAASSAVDSCLERGVDVGLRDLGELVVRAAGRGVGVDDLERLRILALGHDHDRVRLDVAGDARVDGRHPDRDPAREDGQADEVRARNGDRRVGPEPNAGVGADDAPAGHGVGPQEVEVGEADLAGRLGLLDPLPRRRERVGDGDLERHLHGRHDQRRARPAAVAAGSAVTVSVQRRQRLGPRRDHDGRRRQQHVGADPADEHDERQDGEATTSGSRTAASPARPGADDSRTADGGPADRPRGPSAVRRHRSRRPEPRSASRTGRSRSALGPRGRHRRRGRRP